MAIKICGNTIIPNLTGCNTTSGNISVGISNLSSLTTGTYNTAIGSSALLSNTAGSNNFAAGYQPLYCNTTGVNNSAIGYQALYNNTIGSNNFAQGYKTMLNNTIGKDNVAIGCNALYNNTTGCNNTAIGYQSLNNNTTGYNNIAIGCLTLFGNTSGYNNTAQGYKALRCNTTGSNNVAIGACSLYNSNATGSNIAIGYCAGANLTTGINNVIIGGYTVAAGPLNATSSNTVVLADGAGNIKQVIDSSGNVGIGLGATLPSYKLHVVGSFAATTKSFVIDHPTKEGMKLRYGSLEGPENGVYVRGRLDGDKVINLPDYWEGLVDLDTITVNLTAIGHSQNLYVSGIDGLKIHIDTENHTQPYCFYHVYGERKDVDKLVVEF